MTYGLNSQINKFCVKYSTHVCVKNYTICGLYFTHDLCMYIKLKLHKTHSF